MSSFILNKQIRLACKYYSNVYVHNYIWCYQGCWKQCNMQVGHLFDQQNVRDCIPQKIMLNACVYICMYICVYVYMCVCT